MTELIKKALLLGAVVYGSVSGGKDGQAMVRTLMQNNVPVEALIHCDLGRAEWPQSLPMCQKQAAEYNLPLWILKRKDGLDLVAYIWRRLDKLKAEGKPTLCWPSAKARYCTSDMKRLPSNQFFISTGHGLIISAEGIRAEESPARAKKEPLSIRSGVTSSFYDGMTVEEALEAYRPDKRLVLNWYPIFNMTVAEVWWTYFVTPEVLRLARGLYICTGRVSDWWPFHPAYAMGNERVSCVFCILGCGGDLKNGAQQAPELLDEYIRIQEASGHTFKDGFDIAQLKQS